MREDEDEVGVGFLHCSRPLELLPSPRSDDWCSLLSIQVPEVAKPLLLSRRCNDHFLPLLVTASSP